MMEEDVEPAEYVEKLHPFGEAAYTSSSRVGVPWHELSLAEQLHWTKVADGVLYAYDEEWTSIKAGY